MAAFHVVTLMKASSCDYHRPTRTAPGETLGSGVPDRVMAALRCRFSLGSIVCGAALEARGGAASSCTELWWRYQVMPSRQVLRFVMPVRWMLRTTDLLGTSSCVGWWYLLAWCCHVPAVTATCSVVCAQGCGAVGRRCGVDGWSD